MWPDLEKSNIFHNYSIKIEIFTIINNVWTTSLLSMSIHSSNVSELQSFIMQPLVNLRTVNLHGLILKIVQNVGFSQIRSHYYIYNYYYRTYRPPFPRWSALFDYSFTCCWKLMKKQAPGRIKLACFCGNSALVTLKPFKIIKNQHTLI